MHSLGLLHVLIEQLNSPDLTLLLISSTNNLSAGSKTASFLAMAEVDP